jgi:N-methylhydantoinase B/oxoprolinase/acetone carboxylase alpha subunit
LCPAEIAEARYGLDVLERSLNLPPDPTHRGGAGLKTRYRARGSAVLSVGMSRATQPVWSADGRPGGTNTLSVKAANGKAEALRFASGYPLGTDDEVAIISAYGGG